MNFIFTTLWLIATTFGSFKLGQAFYPGHMILFSILGLVIGLMLRFGMGAATGEYQDFGDFASDFSGDCGDCGGSDSSSCD